MKLTKHVDIDQYKYFGYGIGFDREGVSSPHINNKKKDHKDQNIHCLQRIYIQLTLLKKIHNFV